MITPISLSTLPNITDDIKTAVPIGSLKTK